MSLIPARGLLDGRRRLGAGLVLLAMLGALFVLLREAPRERELTVLLGSGGGVSVPGLSIACSDELGASSGASWVFPSQAPDHVVHRMTSTSDHTTCTIQLGTSPREVTSERRVAWIDDRASLSLASDVRRWAALGHQAEDLRGLENSQ